jgi:hypothetical protein
VKSLWAPGVRWTEVTEEGFRGGPVMPDNYNGSPAATEQLRGNIARASIVGSLVGNDFRSSMLVVPLLDKDPVSGQRIDYPKLSQRSTRSATASKPTATPHARDRLRQAGRRPDRRPAADGPVLRRGRGDRRRDHLAVHALRALDALVLACSLVAVVWQLGLVAGTGFELDPYSILVPFLVFAIGVSHGAQKMNGIMQDIAAGAHRLVAARFTFRPPVPGRRDGAGGRRGGLRGA